MPTLALKATASPGKFGLVRVFNTDKTLNRAFKITALELAAVLAGSGPPPNVTAGEWTSGRVLVYGKDFDTGDCQRQPDGSAIIKLAERTVNGDILEAFVRIPAGDYSGLETTLTVTADKLPNLKMLTTRQGPILVTISSITNGTLTWQLA